MLEFPVVHAHYIPWWASGILHFYCAWGWGPKPPTKSASKTWGRLVFLGLSLELAVKIQRELRGRWKGWWSKSLSVGCLHRDTCKGISWYFVCRGIRASVSIRVLYKDPGSLSLLPKMPTTEVTDCPLMNPKQVEGKLEWKLETGEISECWTGSWEKQHSSLRFLSLITGKINYKHCKLKQEEMKKAFKEARRSLPSSPLMSNTFLAFQSHKKNKGESISQKYFNKRSLTCIQFIILPCIYEQNIMV